jgi:hypothetical protein
MDGDLEKDVDATAPGYRPPIEIKIKCMSVAGGGRRAKVIVPPEIEWVDFELSAQTLMVAVCRAAVGKKFVNGFERAMNILVKDTLQKARQQGRTI